ncbi:glycosyltransferase family 2 protein [Salinibacillus xinjiangensis]|uniref:Glycosyltransferase n=1 Tax=Salinibacillus xinjiangensis TaxID=1229268 RepID=A0A6G1X8Z7_9BACI|nr:glycosyltransferase family 2 protein [Salinibacillus xinjiangensis]MRG87417.1 glycosyltransferase [Salinibacillus xinjiangensis]
MDPSFFTFIKNFNFLMFLLFTLMYSYRFVYMLIAFKMKKSKKINEDDVQLNKYAVIIAARNEEVVIGELIKSIKKQNYPRQYVDIFVVADNCTDKTSQVAREAGAIVRERFNKTFIGKGYALDFMFNIIEEEYKFKDYDGYFVFDADNVLEENYIAEMNKTLNQGYRVITSYRNSKNFGHNWISAGYSLWFMHEAEYLNHPRMILNSSCAISGTGFLVQADLIRDNGGWIHHLLTEDIEFSIHHIIKGEKIGYCKKAIFYDEQPVTFKQSWNQRLRWAKGFYQVFLKYGKNLVGQMFLGKCNKFSCYDMTMTIMPALLISCLSMLINVSFYLTGLILEQKEIVDLTNQAILESIGSYYGLLYLVGFITTLTEWKTIYCSSWKKIGYTFTFPIFMFTYIPISIVALFKNVEWKPIAHTEVKTLDDIR